MSFRHEDEMFAVALSDCGATLFTRSITSGDSSSSLASSSSSCSISSSVNVPPPVGVAKEEHPKQHKKTAMELNVAYEAYEKMRKLNLELECSEAGIQFKANTPIDFDMCTTCLITKGPPVVASSSPSSAASTALTNKVPAFSTSSGKPLFPRLYKLRVESQDFLHASQQSLREKAKKQKGVPCLLCGAPSCSEHSSAAFRKENITLCNTCVTSLEFDFDDDRHRSELMTKQVEYLVDLYDRALLLLQYSSQFMLQVALSLEASTERHNQVGVGGSSVGIVSGVLGVAAACTILTPAGPPLLIASLVFGGSATAVQTGSEAMKYFSEPNKLADRMLALMGMVQAILSTTRSMRETTLVPYLDRAVLSLTKKQMESSMKTTVDSENKAKVQKAVTAGTRIGSTAATGMATLSTGLVQEGAAAGRFMSRASTNLARSARFARFAGGALSAATLVLEARELTNTVKQIRQGNPCEKAEALRRIHAVLGRLPSTQNVDAMCQSYAKVRAKQLATKRLLHEQERMEQSAVIVEENEHHDLMLVEEVVSSLEAQHEDSEPVRQKQEPYAPTTTTKRIDLSKSTLLERVQRYKERQETQQAEIDLVI